MPSDLREKLMTWASAVLTGNGRFKQLWFEAELFACQLLGLLGGPEHQSLLHNWHLFKDIAPSLKDIVAEESEAASRQISIRHIAQAALKGESSTPEAAAAFPNSNSSPQAEPRGASDTDLRLEEALTESEREHLLREQAHLQEQLLRIKALEDHGSADVRGRAQNSTSSNDHLVLLCFGRRPKELYDVLRKSSLAVRVEAAGGALQPDWAGGRLILAESVTEASISEVRTEWHVAVHAADEDEVYKTLRSTMGRDRPRVKASDGRFLAPHATSLFQVSESDLAEDEQLIDEPRYLGDLADFDVQRTFIDFRAPGKAAAAPRTSASAPAAL